METMVCQLGFKKKKKIEQNYVVPYINRIIIQQNTNNKKYIYRCISFFVFDLTFPGVALPLTSR